MDRTSQAQQILTDAEKSLHELAVLSLQEKDYQGAQTLSAMAQNLALIVKVGERVAAANGVVVEDSAGEMPTVKLGRALTNSSLIAAGETFPKFFRERETLVKIGYSKTDKRTYEHRSPRAVLAALVDVLSRLGNAGDSGAAVFTAEDVMVVRSERLKGVPTYQIYSCLSFLIRHGLVRRNGRSEYLVEARTGSLESSTESAWSGLPAR